MLFGLHSAPATFQRAKDKALCLHWKYTLYMEYMEYMDNIVICSTDWKSCLLCWTLKKEGFTFNLKKYAIAMDETRSTLGTLWVGVGVW